jgi:TP901 family phage tail tape measure protein
MAELGFNVLDANGKLRDMGTVIEEIGNRWEDLTREQQISLAQTMAGQRQYSNLIALFDNFEQYNKALATAQNAAGTLQDQQSIYMESMKAHLNELTAAVEGIYKSFSDPKSINGFIDGLTSIAKLIDHIVTSIGGGGSVLTALGAIGVNVFSNQIAASLQTTIDNTARAKAQSEEFQAVLENIRSLTAHP